MMNLNLLKKSAILFVLVALVLPGVTQATTLGTVDISMTGFYAYDIMEIWAGGYYNGTTHSGVTMLEKTGGYGDADYWANGPIAAVCAEQYESPSNELLEYSVLMPEDTYVRSGTSGIGLMGTAKADYLRELWGRYYDSSWTSGSYTETQKIFAAAFSAAVKEIIHEDLPESTYEWDVTNGTFYIDYDYSSIANLMLYSLDGTGPSANLRVFSYDGAQDYIVEVPEPATMVLLGCGGVLGLLRRRRMATK
ncbi:MAG: PEP-CTERM sorting domain-containing protein [Sedimentisphaerales bacterium]|nr:PEP-CTERM sorting domain-containing protein [Sedimentisphaerales bacterium]